MLVDAVVLLELVKCVAVAADTEGKGGLRELVEYVAIAADTATDCACLAFFLAAAFVCQPHKHGLLMEG